MTGLTNSKFFRHICADNLEVFLLLPITRHFTERDEPAVGSGTATYSTCLSFTKFEIRAPLPALGAPNQGSLLSQKAFRRKKTFSWQDCKADTTCWLHPSSNTDQGLNSTPYSQWHCQQRLEHLSALLCHCRKRNFTAWKTVPVLWLARK